MAARGLENLKFSKLSFLSGVSEHKRDIERVNEAEEERNEASLKLQITIASDGP